MRVDLEQFEEWQAYVNAINKCPIEKIEIYKEGAKVEIPEKFTSTFKYVGLNHEDYVSMILNNEIDELLNYWNKNE